MLAALLAGTLAAQERASDLTVRSVAFDGNRAVDDYTLSAAIATSASSWTYRLLHLGERRRFDELEFRRDVLRLQLFYRQHGYFDARIDTAVERGSSSVKVKFRIAEGPPVLLDSIAITGAEGARGAPRQPAAIPLQRGSPFDRYLFDASSDSIAYALRNRGYPYAAVYRNYDVDRRTRTASVRFAAEPGPRARIGEIRVEGNRSVSTTTVKRSLTLRSGDLFRQSALFDSQRSLYQTGLYRYASVAVAPDSAVGGADSLVRLRVQVSEASRLQMRAGAGYGTIDCFRTQATVAVLNFLGEARRLDVVGRVSKIGVGSPLDFGLRNTLCRELATDRFSYNLNYFGSVTFTQPAFLFRRASASFGVFAERRSEFNAYLFQSLGAALSLRAEVARNLPLSLSYRVSNDRTDADPATFCIYFSQCDPGTLDPFAAARREATLTVSLVHTKVDSPIEPTRGHVYSLEAMTARDFLGSEIVFDRLVGEATVYRRIGPRSVLAARVRGGILRQGTSRIGALTLAYVPPNDRFYAGGPTTVRGFGRNEMGPLVYVVDTLRVNPGGDTTFVGLRSSPLGSSAIALANVELRLPTPLWGGHVGLNLFVDSGELWDYDGSSYVAGGFRVTPGLGMQITTPLGPMRLDAAYNGYATTPGRLYEIRGTDLQLRIPDFPGRTRGSTFLSRLQFHFSVGLAF